LGLHSKFYQWSFAKRPREEFYDLSNDPEQLKNLATEVPKLVAKYRNALKSELRASGDPRHGGPNFDFAEPAYTGGGPRFPGKR